MMPYILSFYFRDSSDDIKLVKAYDTDIQSFQSGTYTSIDEIVTKITPWIRHKNMHGNYFMNGRVEKIDNPLLDSSLVFIHHPRTGGSKLIECLNNISLSYNLPMSPLMTSKNRELWDTGNPDTNSFRDKIKIHRGKFSFGMCENFNKKCSYVILLRDPLERIASSHKYCQTFANDETCGHLDARETSLRDWILSQRSVLFKQLLFSPHFCNDDQLKKYNLSAHYTNSMSCWTKNNLILEHLTEDYKDNITKYIVDNLHKMISLIGLSEELELSLRMLEKSFKFPFTTCNMKSPHQIHLNNEINSNRALKNHVHDETASMNEIEDDSDVTNLVDDVYIQKALSSDYAIYKEAKRIFHIQKQNMMNTVR